MTVLAVDIGNTTITLGLVDESRCLGIIRTPSGGDPEAVGEAFSREVEQLRAAYGEIKGAIVASVVPALTPVVERALSDSIGIKPLRLTHDTPLPVRNGYGSPREVGLDRLANAVGGVVVCGAPVIVVDAGTAVTLDVVSGEGVFLGGAILPGAELWTKALNDFTAALPRVTVAAPGRTIGTSTVENIQSGIVNGLAGAIDRLVEEARVEMGGAATVVLTGGAAPLLIGRCRTVERTAEALTLLGLARIYTHNSD